MEFSLFIEYFVGGGKGGQAACVVGIFILSCVILYHCFKNRRAMARESRAEPPSWPVLGMLPYVFLHLHEIYEWSSEVLIQYGGTIDFKPPWMTNMFSLVTIDPKNIEYIVKTKFASFPRGAYFKTMHDDLMGNGILNVDSQEWVRTRKTLSSIFHSQAYKNHLILKLKEVAKRRLMPAAEAACKSGAVVDLQRLLVHFTFYNLCVAVFGCGIDFEEVELDAVAEAFEYAVDSTIRRFIVPSTLWKAARMLGVGSEGKLKASLEVINEFVYRLISIRRKQVLAGNGGVPRQDLLSKLIQMDPASDEEVRDMCISFLLAGRDTTSIGLSWFFWLLNQHPIVERNVLLEIQEVLERRSSEEKYDELRVEEVREMQYLHAALSESMRIYPPLPINFKQVKEDEVLPDGRRLKKGMSLLISIYGMGRAESVWGNDCREFKPERWLKEGIYVEENYAAKYPVFNIGPRMCLGKDFAYLQMKWVAALFIYRYRMEVRKDVVVEPKLAANLFMKNGLRVTLHPRHPSSLAANKN